MILENRRTDRRHLGPVHLPGIRSDSDIFTPESPARNPWRGNRLIAQGHEIRQYLEDLARDFGIAPHIRFRTEVVAANFDTGTDLWTVDVRIDGEPATYQARFLVYSCTGYFRYDAGYLPEFSRQGRLHRHRGAPAVLAGRPRLRRQEGGGDRQRCHRGHTHPVDGPDRRARDHAAAFTHLSVPVPVDRPHHHRRLGHTAVVGRTTSPPATGTC